MPDPMTEYVNVRLPKDVAEFIAEHWHGTPDSGGDIRSTLEQQDVGDACRQALQEPEGAAGPFVRAGTPESEALHVEGSYFAAHHIGGTTWRFGSGDEAKDDQLGVITLAPHGYHQEARSMAEWIVSALDSVKAKTLAAMKNSQDGE